MPASRLIAGMARSYGCQAISFTNGRLTQKMSCIKDTRVNHHANFHGNINGQLRFSS